MTNKPCILVVDDEEIVRLNIERILEDEYCVQTAAGGEEAVNIIREEKIDLVLTDLIMADIDGFSLLEEIKRNTPEMVVIIITGYGSLPSAVTAMQYGAYDYIIKPCNKEELLIRVKKGLEKAEIEKRLLQTRKMETILSNIGVFILDEHGVIINANEALAERIWGDMDVVGKRIWELPYLIGSDVASDLAKVLKGECVEQDHVEIPANERRSKLIISYDLRPVDSQKGDKNLIWVVEDITKKVHIIQQVSQTERLTSLGKLAAGVAHEINNPLNIISLDVEYIKEQLEADNPLHEHLNSINGEVDRIAQIVQQLQEQSRTQESIQEGADFNQLLNNHIFQIIFGQLRKKGIKLNLFLDAEQEDLLIPKNKLTQVLMNLIKNAEDAMSGGGILTISNFSTSEDVDRIVRNVPGAKKDKMAKILVSDSGCGIKKEHLPYIFEPFFTTKGFEGTGLGLFISYTIVKGYNGDIELQTEENKGTTFTITLPLAEKREL